MNTVIKRVTTQFDLTKSMLNNLSQYEITPTAKLVLLYLTDCYNPNHADVFPKQKTIAAKLGISERSVIRAVQELFKAGLILIECKHTNRYILMPNSTSQLSQNNDKLSQVTRQIDTFIPDNLSHTCIEQKRITKKEQHIEGGNVYIKSEPQFVNSESDFILRDYAIKHGARNVNAYINTLKQTKSAENIIKEYKRAKTPSKLIKHTSKILQQYEEFKKDAVSFETSTEWLELGKKLGIKRKL